MSEPLVLTMKATDKAGLVKNLRLGASLGWEVRYAMDRDNARLLADAIEECITVWAMLEDARAAHADIDAKIDRMKAEVRKMGLIVLVYAAIAFPLVCALWWPA